MSKFFRNPRHRGFLRELHASKIENRKDKRVSKLRVHSEVMIGGSWEDISREQRVRRNGKEKRLYYRRLARKAKLRTQE